MDPSTTDNNTHDYVALIELGKQLISASRAGNVDTVVQLMHFGAPFATDWWGMTALHHAALHGHLEVVNLLITSGILKDSRSKVDKTPLHLACQEGHTAIALFLISNGAEINAVDMILMTPLHWAVEMNHLDTVKMLIENGAQSNLANKFDKTCFDIAADKAHYEIFVALKEGDTSINYDKDKIKTYIPAKGKKSATNGSLRNEVTLPKNDEVWDLLEQHGIEMLEGEDVNLVAAALGSGQSVYLTEAGRQALTLTGRARQPNIITLSSAKSTSEPAVGVRQPNTVVTAINSTPKRPRPNTHITITTSKPSQPPEAKKVRVEAMLPPPAPPAAQPTVTTRKQPVVKNKDSVNDALVAGFYEKFMQAKKEAKYHHSMYLKKRQEAEHYLKKLTATVKSISEDEELLNSHLNDTTPAFLDDDDDDVVIDEPLDKL